MLKRFVVKGHSMQPSFYEGDRILVNLWPIKLREKDVILFETEGKTILKRIKHLNEPHILTEGDNKTCRKLLRINKTQVVGKFLTKY